MMKKNNTKKAIAITVVIAVIMAVISMFSAGAAEIATITVGDYEKLHIQLNTEEAFCVERTAVMPEKGVQYTATNFEHPEMLNTVAIATVVLDDGTDSFKTAKQYAVWQCYEQHLPMDKMANAKYGQEVANKVNDILNFIPVGEWDVEVKFYEANERQTICTFDATPVKPTEPTTIATEPTEPETEPTMPTEPKTEPTEPKTEATEPTVPTEPTEPETKPTEPTIATEPTIPTVETTVPTEPTEVETPTITENTTDVPKTVLSEFDAPQTGDNSGMTTIILIITIVISLLALCYLVVAKKQR